MFINLDTAKNNMVKELTKNKIKISKWQMDREMKQVKPIQKEMLKPMEELRRKIKKKITFIEQT